MDHRFQAEAHPLLRPYVHSHWGLSRDLSALGGFTVTPDRFLELIFFVDPPGVEQAGAIRPLPVCTLIPLLGGALRLTAGGVVLCAAVRLHAWAAGLVFSRLNTAEAAWIDATPIFAESVAPISDALRRRAWPEIPPLLDAAMLRALADARPAGADLAAARAFTSLSASAPSAGGVSARQGRSRRQVERRVRALTHRSPKQLVCLARFQRVRDALWANPRTELAALAFEAGYSDQAHLTRHFRRYAGQTPGEFIRDCARLKTFLRSGNVAVVQDD